MNWNWLSGLDVNWLTGLAAAAGVLLVGLIFIGLSGRRAARALAVERKRATADAEEFRTTLAALQAQIATVAELTQKAPVTTPAEPAPELTFVPAPTLSADQRAEALGMLRKGIGSQTVCTTLRLSQAEMALLQKVQSFLDSTSSVGVK